MCTLCVCVRTHIYKHTGHMYLPAVSVCNPHPCPCADVLHQHITSTAAPWLGLAVTDDQNLSLELWTAHNTSADGCYMISYIDRGTVSTGTGVMEKPLPICTGNMQSSLQPCLVWLHWPLINIFLEYHTFAGCIRVMIHIRDIFVCNFQKVTHVIDVIVECYDLQ